MYVIKLENTVTHQIHRFESEDMNNGSKLYYEFNVNTLELEDGEYILTLCDSEDNVLSEDILRIGDFTPQTLQYKAGGDTYISIEFDAKIGPKKAVLEGPTAVIEPDEGYDGFTYVEIDANALVDNAKNEGYEEGIEYQKTQLTTIDITENGVYTNDNGYSEVIVNVPDLNGSYDEGYEQGYGDGYTEGETVSYESGYEDGYVAANEDVAETARVLNITENGIYCSEYSKEGEDYVFDEPITGDGDYYDYIEVNDIGFNTGIIPTEYTKVELWVNPSGERKQDTVVFGSQNALGANGIFKIRITNGAYEAEWNGLHMSFDMEDNVWHHIIFGKEYGLIIDGEVLYEPWDDGWRNTTSPIGINCVPLRYKGINGCYGMVKIDDTVFVPSELGYINTTTNEALGTEAGSNEDFIYFNIKKPICEGNLIRTVNVNVPPLLDTKEKGISFGFSSFEKLPQGLVNWSKVTNMSNMFRNCDKLKEFKEDISNINIMYNAFYECTNLTDLDVDTSNVINMEYTFYNCKKLKKEDVAKLNTSKVTTMNSTFYGCTFDEFPTIDTSKVHNMGNMFQGTHSTLKKVNPIDTSNVGNMSYMFYDFSGEHILEELPEFDCTKVTSMSFMFSYYQDRMDNFTTCGGWKNLKCKWDDNYGLRGCANLSYQSCINILNGLYDFVGNGETPNSSQGKLKVHQNFLDTVGDEITIGTNKGWTITV